MNVVVYHKTDLDGHCSGAITRLFLEGIESDRELLMVGAGYNDELPWEDWCNRDTAVFVVDFSLSLEAMTELNEKSEELIWIDHHKTAIERLEGLEIEGKRDLSKAGCELCWEFFHPEKPMPSAVYLLGRYDVWEWRNVKNGIEFQYGMRNEVTDPSKKESLVLWKSVLDDITLTMDRIICNGGAIYNYQILQDTNLIRFCSYTGEFDGYLTLFLNAPVVSSMMFEQVASEYPEIELFVGYYFKRNRWKFALRRGNSEVDVSEIAKKYGGGGHPGAAGFYCREIPPGIL